MSTPQSTTFKGPRRSNRPPKQNVQTTRSAMSENEIPTTTFVEHSTGVSETKHKQKRKQHANKRSDGNQDAAIQSDGPSQRSIVQPERPKTTPMKQQAYAGPTFHQSPAASTLPMPRNFLARSLPNSTLVNPSTIETSSPDRNAISHVEPPRPISNNEPKRETTPLDFLFDAARKAHTTPSHDSPNMRFLSPAHGSPAANSPAGREAETQFPFEFDSAEPIANEDGAPFTTPYRDRIDAARSARSTAEGGRHLQESERQAKSAALKDFIMKSAQQTHGQVDNPFNAKPILPSSAMQDTFGSQQQGTKHHSNPSSPLRNGHQSSNGYQYFPPMPYVQNGLSPGPRTPGSNLRNIYSPELGRVPAELSSVHQTAEQRISTARNGITTNQHYPQPYEHHYYNTPNEAAVRARDSSHQSPPSAQQLENDLRRILKIDLTSQG